MGEIVRIIRTPEKRTERKAKEFEMATIRTIFNVITGVVAIISFIFTMLIYHKVYGGM